MDISTIPQFIVYAKRRNCHHLMAQIYLRITYQGERQDRSMGVSCSYKAWDSGSLTIKNNPSLTASLQEGLTTMKNKILGAFYILRQTSPEISLKEVVAIALEESKTQMFSVYGCFEALIAKMERAGLQNASLANVQKHKACLRHLRAFVSNEYQWNDFPFTRINRIFVDGFVGYLKTEAACAHNTAMKHLSIFKKVYKIALDNQWIRYNAFSGYRIGLKPVIRSFLTEEEIGQIMTKQLHIGRLALVRDLFIFACFTGLAYIDLKNLRRKNLVENLDLTWIKIRREKTGVEATIPLLQPARRILEKYSPQWKFQDPEKQLFKTLSNQKMNAYLKEIADLCGLSKSISFHIGRHSFATSIALSNNIPMETVSKMLGHSRISMTQHYSKVIDLKIARDVEFVLVKYK